LRLLADQHISPKTVEYLKLLGHDVVTVALVLSPTAQDSAIVDVARAEQRVVLTQDLDYTSLIALSKSSSPSLLLLRVSKMDAESVNALLATALPMVEKSLSEGAIVTLTENTYRVRALPLN